MNNSIFLLAALILVGAMGVRAQGVQPDGSWNFVMPSGSRNIQVVYELIEYNITYDLDGGAMEDGVTNLSSYTVETPTFTLNNPIRSGYTFVGWMGTDIASVQLTVTVTQGELGNRAYTANWQKNEPTEVESVQPSDTSTRKFLRDGQLIIERDGAEYNAEGRRSN